MNKLRVLLADDHRMMREGLTVLVAAQSDMEVVAEADGGWTAVTLAEKLHPDVVVMDVSMPEANGLKATMMLQSSCPEIKILALTRHRDRGYVQQLLQAGASGYVLKQSASEELVRGIRAVSSGRTYLDPAITEQAVDTVIGVRADGGSSVGKSLSKREEEVLRLIAWGLLSREIAARLDISIKTVEAHKANGMTKLGMKSRTDVVRYALLRGWLEDT
jgi:DNA-binding NarL/FixJ family response regulator